MVVSAHYKSLLLLLLLLVYTLYIYYRTHLKDLCNAMHVDLC